MKPETVERLLALNRGFYQRAARSFSETRRAPWPGWARLLERFTEASAVSVLDLGCGHGRFLAELERRGLARDYLGVDSSGALLELARTRHPGARFLEADATALAIEERFDLVVAFGLLHHLPSFELRARFIRHFAPLVRDVVFAGEGRSDIGALIFLAGKASPEQLRDKLASFPNSGSSNRIAYAMVLEEPPSLDAGEMTYKGSINQRAVLASRKQLVEELFSDSERVLRA